MPLKREPSPEALRVVRRVPAGGSFLIVTILLVSVTLIASKANASPGTSIPFLGLEPSPRPLGSTRANVSVAAVTRWVQATGRPTVIRAPIARALGLPVSDVAVRERGFRVTGEKLTHVCAVAIDDNITFFASTNEETGDAVIWRPDVAGSLVATAAFSNGSATRVTNESLYAQFVSERDYFLYKAQNSAEKPRSTTTVPALVIKPSPSPRPVKVARADGELPLLFLYPWVIPVVIGTLIAGMGQPTRRTRDEVL